jgi:hypothetical protein
MPRKPMTHRQKKADLFIVALKPANKPGRLRLSWWSNGIPTAIDRVEVLEQKK